MKRLMTGIATAILLFAGSTPVSAQSEAIEYYGLDALGSVRVIFDQQGNVVDRMDYDPFGANLRAAIKFPTEQFAQLARDAESGLDYAQARNYSAGTGRFNRVDPIYAGLFEPQKWNRYAYALDSPLSYFDPEGLDPDCPTTFCVGVTGAMPNPLAHFWRPPIYGDLPITLTIPKPILNRQQRPGTQSPTVTTPTPTPTPTPSPGPNHDPSEGERNDDTGCATVPAAPPVAKLQQNMQEARMMRALMPSRTTLWFYDRVRSNTAGEVRAGRSWDYKRLGPQYEEFGNFNYGATGHNAGFSRLQLTAGSLKAHFDGGFWNALRPSNLLNEFKDQAIIARGFSYAAKGCR